MKNLRFNHHAVKTAMVLLLFLMGMQYGYSKTSEKRILFMVSSASEIGPKHRKTGNLLTELANAYYIFNKQGYDIDIYSVKGGDAPIDMNDVKNPINSAFLHGEGAAKMKNTKSIAQLNIAGYDAVYIPGGLAPVVDMPDNPTVQKIIAEMYENGKVVSAVCHGPVALINVKLKDGSYLLHGKNVAGFTKAEEKVYALNDVPFNLEDKIRERTTHYHSVAPFQPYSIADGKLVTGQNPASAKGVAEKVVAILER